MKKLIFALVICLAMLLSGCTQTATEPLSDAVATESPVATPEPEDPFYTAMMASADERPVAVMIDNDEKAARPQVGMEDAYLVYEVTVEGSATRFMALFRGQNTDKVGPVRSSRHYFLDFALEHDAIYVHAGWSPQASRDISSLGVNNINGIMGGDGQNFWRDKTYDSTWHNLYTGVDKLKSYAEGTKKYRMTTDNAIPAYYKVDTDLEGQPATAIKLPYANFYQVSYTYEPDKKLYERYINGAPHTSQRGGTFSAKNVLVLYMDNFDLNDGEHKGRQDLADVGSGSGYFFTNGVCQPITWSKASRTAKTVYTYEDGTEVTLNPGTTYVQIIPQSKGVTFE